MFGKLDFPYVCFNQNKFSKHLNLSCFVYTFLQAVSTFLSTKKKKKESNGNDKNMHNLMISIAQQLPKIFIVTGVAR